VIAQIDILLRRSQHRLDKIADRLELLEGYIIAYLNLDRIIEIIRTEDEPKPVMMAEFEPDRPAGRSDPQHAAAVFAQA
jgi:topoisomerase-4 subunit A